jgi:CHAT domain-containing protein
VARMDADDESLPATMMESYYRNLLAGQGRAAALQEAALSLRARHPHPHS